MRVLVETLHSIHHSQVMSAEPPEDAKPKLNLVISLLEARMFSPSDGLVHNLTTRAVGITVKVKANMQFKKIFEVAEVCRDLFLVITHVSYSSFRNDSEKILVRLSSHSFLDKMRISNLDASRDSQIRLRRGAVVPN